MCSEGANRRGISCPPFLSLLLLFFYGKLRGGKYGGVCHVDAEKELQCLAAGVACRYTAHTLVERFEGMVLDEGYPVNLDVVDLGSKLHASDDRTDVGAVNADNAVLNLLFLSQRALLAEHFLERSQAF